MCILHQTNIVHLIKETIFRIRWLVRLHKFSKELDRNIKDEDVDPGRIR